MRRRAIGALAIWLALLNAPPGAANELSERSYSVGLAELHGHRGSSDDPLKRFEAAVAADPEDPYARYYLGVARAAGGDLDAAADELSTALRLKPDFTEAAADLGVVLVRLGRNAEAIPVLAQAEKRPDLRARSKLVLGVARLRLGELDTAIADFRASSALDPTVAAVADYYEGVALRRRGDQDLARRKFEEVVRATPDTSIGREAARFLRSEGSSVERPYTAYAAVGVDYDSNVTLETGRQSRLGGRPLPDAGDGNVHFRVGGRLQLWRGERTALTAGYEFFQRLYFDLEDYNLQAHRPDIRLTHEWRQFRFGLATDYDFFLLDRSSYLQRFTASPWAAMHEADWGRTEISYRLRWNGFFRPPPGGGQAADPDSELGDDVLDSLTHRPILRQYIYIDGPERYVSIAYRFERREPIGNGDERFGFDGHGVELGAGWVLPAQIQLRANYEFQREEYDGDGRVDEPHRLTIGLRRFLTEYIAATVAYRGLFHESNQFEYERHIASLGLEVFL